jgi:hypothetical protein
VAEGSNGSRKDERKEIIYRFIIFFIDNLFMRCHLFSGFSNIKDLDESRIVSLQSMNRTVRNYNEMVIQQQIGRPPIQNKQILQQRTFRPTIQKKKKASTLQSKRKKAK